jgi:SET domain-containing protein
MKHLIIFAIIILGFIILKCIETETETFNNEKTFYKLPSGIVKESKVGGRGVFALQDFNKGDIIEICPCIKQQTNTIFGKIFDYIFRFDDDNSLLAFGYCPMYNHSDNNNASWTIMNDEQMQVEALEDIKKGEEIFVSYGEPYWESRKNMEKNK